MGDPTSTVIRLPSGTTSGSSAGSASDIAAAQIGAPAAGSEDPDKGRSGVPSPDELIVSFADGAIELGVDGDGAPSIIEASGVLPGVAVWLASQVNSRSEMAKAAPLRASRAGERLRECIVMASRYQIQKDRHNARNRCVGARKTIL